MKRRVHLWLLTLSLTISITHASAAQGTPGGGQCPNYDPPAPRTVPGSYEGPGDTVPTGGDTARPGTARPASPGAPAAPSAGDIAPATRTQLGAGSQMFASTAFDSGLDTSTWQLWWYHNRHAYLDLKASILTVGAESGSDTFFLGQGNKIDDWDVLMPTPRQVREDVVPALLGVLGSSKSPELHRRALLALARVAPRPAGGERRGPSPYALVFETFLASGDVSLVETAAVALGVLSDEGSIRTLVSLMKDDQAGHKLVRSTRVPMRVRASAAYGLGLIGSHTAANARRQEIAEHLIDILDAPHFATRDLKVAAMISLGMTPLAWGVGQAPGTTPHAVVSREGQIEFLLDYFDPGRERANNTTRQWLVRAHAPVAIGRLCGGAPESLRDRAARAMLAAIRTRTKEQREIQQGCVLALGMLGDADALPDSVDTRIRTELVRVADQGDLQSRRFALIALAQSGARPGQDGQPYAGLDATRDVLLRHLSRGRSQMKPWAAMALGVMGHALHSNDQPVAQRTLSALRRSCADNRRPAEAGAHMLALGLLGDTASTELLADKLDFFKGSANARGDAAVAMGLAGDPAACDALRPLLEEATYRPLLFARLATGLGLCGDKALVPDLARDLLAASGFGSQAPIARALGQIGDSRSIPALVRMLEGDGVTDSTRAIVATALGSICDRAPLPWTARISAGVNYSASTVTLTSVDGTGAIDS